MEIIFDFRGEFNVITKAALKIIEREDGRLQRLNESQSIPSYLKKERKTKFKAVNLELEAYFVRIEEEAMILPNEVPCVLIGRHACKRLDHINRVRQRKDETYVLSRWDKRRSARVMDKMRLNLEKTQMEKAESRHSEATQETNQELGKSHFFYDTPLLFRIFPSL